MEQILCQIMASEHMYSKWNFNLSSKKSPVLKHSSLLCGGVCFLLLLVDWKCQALLLIGFRDTAGEVLHRKGMKLNFFSSDNREKDEKHAGKRQEKSDHFCFLSLFGSLTLNEGMFSFECLR